jgi:CheY-like chemotaxis protein
MSRESVQGSRASADIALLMDLQMPQMSGLDAIIAIHARRTEAQWSCAGSARS